MVPGVVMSNKRAKCSVSLLPFLRIRRNAAALVYVSGPISPLSNSCRLLTTTPLKSYVHATHRTQQQCVNKAVKALIKAFLFTIHAVLFTIHAALQQESAT
jgi:hypothetical protein